MHQRDRLNLTALVQCAFLKHVLRFGEALNLEPFGTLKIGNHVRRIEFCVI